MNDGENPEVDVAYSNNCPYGATLVMFEGANGAHVAETPPSALGPVPLVKPPYARLVAIDLNAGETAWRVPFGESDPTLRDHPLLRRVDLPPRLARAERPARW